jgi:dolichyl-phosphate beta-glucosyltransferase
MNLSVALVIPCYNEETRFPLSLWQEVISTNQHVVFFFVNDGSSDSTLEVLKALGSKPNFRLLDCSSNSGKGNAIRHGFQAAIAGTPEFKVLGFVDSDGAFSPSDIKFQIDMLLHLIEHKSDQIPDVVLSSRVALAGRAIHRKPSRHYLGRVIATLLTRGWVDAPYDTQSGFKLFHNTEAFRHSVAMDFSTKWFFDLEIFIKIAHFKNGNIKLWEEPLNSWKDVDGSKIKASHFFRILTEVLYVRRQVRKYLQLKRDLDGSH